MYRFNALALAILALLSTVAPLAAEHQHSTPPANPVAARQPHLTGTFFKLGADQATPVGVYQFFGDPSAPAGWGGIIWMAGGTVRMSFCADANNQPSVGTFVGYDKSGVAVSGGYFRMEQTDTNGTIYTSLRVTVTRDPWTGEIDANPRGLGVSFRVASAPDR